MINIPRVKNAGSYPAKEDRCILLQKIPLAVVKFFSVIADLKEDDEVLRNADGSERYSWA
jgi:hypothetical protein